MTPETIGAAVAAGSYVVGIGIDTLAVHRVATGEQALTKSWDLAHKLDEADSTAQASRLQLLMHKAGRTLLAPLAIASGATLGVNTAAWLPASAASEKTLPTLEIVVDHSKAVGISFGKKPAVVSEINGVVDQFDDDSAVNAEAWVANSGTVTPMRPTDVPKSQPFGYVDLVDATTQALDKTAEVVPVSDGKMFKREAAVLVITNGNPIVGDNKSLEQDTSSVIAKATKQYKTPIFVVNVEGDAAGSSIIDSLEQVAKETGGRYWDAQRDNLSTVSKAVEKTVVAEVSKNNKTPNSILLKVLGGTLLVMTEELFRRRGILSFGRNARGE